MKYEISPHFLQHSEAVKQLVSNFKHGGSLLGEAARNTIKIFTLHSHKINIKSFRIPGIHNKIIYRYFRKSKARRSFEYANRLLQNGIGTPQPIAFFENYSWLGLEDSYYVSEQLQADLMYRELTTNPDYPDREQILRQYARFAFLLHEKGIEFIDNTSGNTLICKTGESRYEFFLVDLNRMNFHHKIGYSKRIENLSKLTTQEDILQIMSDEYALLYKVPAPEFHARLREEAHRFQDNFNRRRRIKKKIRFWKK